ncbi:helix-turn-helix transcriptional regulator [Flavobacterium sp.]|uniref:helix-turn-helix transcriptional regulator n=1 Tax=Flavobacterium sp. TaxID=239 RepID=UPI003266E76B
MKKKYVYVLFILLITISFSFGQSEKIKKLENQVKIFNDSLQYEKSIAILSDIITNEDAVPYEKYYAYLLKSYTYKRLFNYNQALYNLDLALAEGLKSDHKEEVSNTIEAEKCFVYFDTNDYRKAEALIVHLRKLQFKHLSISTKSWIIMQDGYIKMLHKEYLKAEQLLDEAFKIVAANSPEDLPNIYGKKIELYNRMGLFDNRDTAFKEGVALSKKYKKVKYEMYLYEIMRNILLDNNDYKNAFYIQKKYDLIVKHYDANDANGKLEISEKKIGDENRKLKEQNEKYFDYILYSIIISLLLLLFFGIRLYQTNVAKRILVEKENTRIHNEIEQLTKALDEKGNIALDLSNYNLTERQNQIIELIRSGATNKEIATKLFISENTVKYHLKVIYEILDVAHRSAIK